ncbi:glycerophosphodiester phosphodiesterase family protein [Jiangella alkaliphila]|uniref:Glycerophosphoryl diester phosphodiesterase n=1 Tax=Jiangella alkaliphila TaxID=419479 RepID=A0A1H2HX44_9ACTN|nr:glycerophosphodiester phosphodiesterase family protein [Jiangella alkaliphila]SDU36460.1 glycerophosphoryl diester phosphodiesterase [Jiangella alkaliphila]
MPSTWRTTAVTTAAVALTVAGFVRADDQASPPATPAAQAAPAVRGIEDIHEMYLDHGPDAGVMVIAHRGYWRGAPENSIAAIEQAIERGAHVVEIDVQRTADGHLVLMHDTTVNRTTNGTGAVSSLTLAQIKALRLREHLGGAQAAVTGHQVPTLEEALAVVKDRAMVNLDKGWPFRDQEYELLVETGTLRNAIFKSDAPVAEVEAFLARDPEILYTHVVGDGNAASIGTFADDAGRPQAYELVFDRLTDPQIQPSTVAGIREDARVWINTMWYGLAAGYTDERSLTDPAEGWEPVVERHGASMIQTDDQDALVDWLAARDAGQDWPVLPRNVLRVEAEDYSTDGLGVGYADQDVENRGGAAREYEGIDVCDNGGATVVCWIRGGEWIRYSVDVRVPGRYAVTARVSSPYRPAGRFTVEFDDGAGLGPVDVRTTTGHNNFMTQQVGDDGVLLGRGTHEFTVRIDPDAYQNFNLDHLEFERTGSR